MLGRRAVAKVSSKPGKTRTLNLFLCARSLVLADLPGFGYAKASKSEQRRWAGDVESYFAVRDSLRAVILLVDTRHFPMPADLDAIDWFAALGKPVLVVLTKADKVKRSDLNRRKADIAGILKGKHVEFAVFSAKTAMGKKDVWTWIRETASA